MDLNSYYKKLVDSQTIMTNNDSNQQDFNLKRKDSNTIQDPSTIISPTDLKPSEPTKPLKTFSSKELILRVLKMNQPEYIYLVGGLFSSIVSFFLFLGLFLRFLVWFIQFSQFVLDLF